MTASSDFDTRRGEPIPVDLNQPLDLQIHNRNGDVTVRAVERSEAFIVADEQGHFGSGDGSTFAIDVEQNHIRIQSTPGHIDDLVGQITRAFRRGGSATAFKPGRVRSPQGHYGDADIVVEVPRSMTGRIEIHNTAGDIQVDGFNGDVQATTVSGDLRLLRIRGDLTLQTASGDVTAEAGAGRVSARATSGDIRVDAALCESFQLQTANGDVAVDGMFGSGPFLAQTANGDVRLTLRQRVEGEAGATLTYRAVSGDAHVSPPFRKVDQRRWQLGSGDGSRLIEVMTVSGDLSAGVAPARNDFVPPPSRPAPPRDVPAAPLPPEPVAPPSPIWEQVDNDVTASMPTEAPATSGLGEAERLAVLEAVERGEIDIEEALRRLEAADSSPAEGKA